ncbi:MAG: GNAT family N-acetyltransferase [Ktedonobacterales bacterium]
MRHQAMLKIQPITHIDQSVLQRLVIGYETDEVYRITKSETATVTTFEVSLTSLPQRFVKRYGSVDSATAQRYAAIAQAGHSFAANDGDQCVALAICEVQSWNASLMIWEFHVARSHQGQGIGRRLMETVVGHARSQHLRLVVCETQSTNVPAIRFYRALGFVLDGIDLSLYTNQDYPDGEIAIFMKRYL